MTIHILAWIMLAFNTLTVVLGPFLIGTERKPTTAGSYVFTLVMALLEVPVIGRALGWW